MEYRIFIRYNVQDSDDSVGWFELYLDENLSRKGDKWWCQDVTDYWDWNTRCYYFRDQETADKFKFIYKMTKGKVTDER